MGGWCVESGCCSCSIMEIWIHVSAYAVYQTYGRILNDVHQGNSGCPSITTPVEHCICDRVDDSVGDANSADPFVEDVECDEGTAC